jgi:hypothetical protein
MWRAWLRRERAVLALVAVLALGLGEPLLCIFHCQVWLPIALQNSLIGQHHHDHARHLQALAADTVAPAVSTAFVTQQPAEVMRPHCFMQSGSRPDSGAPFHVPPSPVHDAIPVIAIFMFGLFLLSVRPPTPTGDPPRRAAPPLLRPPICIAA